MTKSQQPVVLDDLLSSIAESIDSTSLVLDKLEDDFNPDNKEVPKLIKSILKTLGSDSDLDSVSLLSLKNASLLNYVTDLALYLSLRLKSFKEEKGDSAYQSNKEDVLNSAATNRIVLEKGIKALEKKTSYQLEKMVSAYHRREKEQDDIDAKKKEQDNDEDNEDEEEDDDDEEDEDEDEAEAENGLNFKPNPSALLYSNKQHLIAKKAEAKLEEEHETETNLEQGEEELKSNKSNEKYKPPKIAATAINDPDRPVKSKKQRNLQSMDEYLQDISDAPIADKSIGSTIINNGRDIKSKKQMEKEAEIQRYEEENFTRLPATKTKENKRERAKRMRNEFFGEDWSMFENNMSVGGNDGQPKKRKRISAWERAKRKIDN